MNPEKNNCRQLQSIFHRALKLSRLALDYLQNNNAEKVLEYKSHLDVIIKHLKNELFNGSDFIKQVETEEFWESFNLALEKICQDYGTYMGYLREFGEFENLTLDNNTNKSIYQKISELSAGIPDKKLSGAQLLIFFKKLTESDTIRGNIKKHLKAQFGLISSTHPELILNMLNSIFMEKNIDPGYRVAFPDGEDIPIDYLSYLHSGRIELGEADSCGGYMGGGTLKAKTAGRASLNNMTGGTAYIGKGEYNIGHSMSGGTIYCEEAELAIAPGAVSGTVLIGNRKIDQAKLETVARESKMNLAMIYCYDEQSREYSTLDYKSGPNDIIFAIQLEEFIKTKQGMIAIKDPDRFENPAENMEGGILVYTLYAPKKDIGKGQKGGIIILEIKHDPLTPEEASARLSKDRSGGFVFLRVFDKNRKTSKLVEIE
jgi:hypothetical protein